MRNITRIISFSLIIIGTLGLLLNEFVVDWGTCATITFDCLNVIGLVILAFITWDTGKRKAN